MIKWYAWPLLLYEMEAWNFKVTSLNKLKVSEMWTLRRMFRVYWMEHVSNTDILKRAGVKRQIAYLY
jgi:hypothetical protein